MGKHDLTRADLMSVIHYDPATGAFTWRGKHGRVAAGKPAGYRLERENRIKIRVFRILHTSHRLAWLYMTGEWPTGDIDHINGDGFDNRWVNLRDVSHLVNMQNMRRARKNSSTGLLGVVATRGRFWAVIRINGHKTFLGSFKTAEEAHARYVTAKRLHHEGCTI